jgi:signal transduction histidine kinase/CHASE1-domain containing sensor protein
MRRNLAAYGALVLGLLMTAAGTIYVQRSVSSAERTFFDDRVAETRARVEQRMDTVTEVMRACRGLFYGSEYGVTREEFHRFVENLKLPTLQIGAQMVGYASALGTMTGDGGRRIERVPVDYLTPFYARTQPLLGLDLWQDPTARQAMEQARLTGEPQASGRVMLPPVPEQPSEPGFFIFVPIYDLPEPASVEGRVRPLAGYVFSPFRGPDLFRDISPRDGPHLVDFEIYDGDQPAPDRLLYDDDRLARGVIEGRQGRLGRLERMEIAGRTWTLFVTTLPAFDVNSSHRLPTYVMFGGLLVSMLLYGIARTQIGARTAAEAAERRAVFFAETSAVLSRSLDYESAMAEVARLAVPFVAEWCSVDLLDESSRIRNVALAHHDHEEMARALDPPGRPPGLPPSPAVEEGLRSGRAELHRHISADLLRPDLPDEERRRLERHLAGRSAIVAPLVARGRTLGAMTFVSAGSGRGYVRADALYLQELARRAALAVDNARLYREAQQAVRARDDFLSVASHELRTPLTSLHLQLEILRAARARGGNPEPGALDAKIEVIFRQARRLSKLIDELLDVSRITAGRLALELEEVDLAAVVDEVVERFRDESARAGCEIAITAERVVGRWDRMRLEQVVTNLLSNALRYSPGKPIAIRVAGVSGEARLEVSDRGPGIAQQDLERIFERFERAVSGPRSGGMGLGLWIVRQIVEAMRGAIRVDSALGVGSTFTVTLPLAEARSHQAA